MRRNGIGMNESHKDSQHTAEGAEVEQTFTKAVEQRVKQRTRELEDALIDSHLTEERMALLVSVVESSEDAIISGSMDGLITSWNLGAERIFGYTAQEIIGQPVTKIIPPDRIREYEKIIDRLKKGQRLQQYETTRLRKNGKPLTVSLTISPLHDRQGNIIGSSAVARNVTAHRRAELDLQRAHTALKNKTAGIEEFLSIMAHDMMHPVVGIQGLMSILKEDCFEKLDPDNQANLNMAIDECEKMKDMIRRLAELGKIGRNIPHPEPTELSRMVHECVNRFRKQLDERHIITRIHAPDTTLTIAQDYVEQALTNLIDNAIKYGCDVDRPRIEVDCRVHVNDLLISVADNGPGIRPEHHKRIFQPFRRMADPDDESSGSGIGLSAVRRLIQELGGDVALHSEPGNGATFIINVPLE